MQRKSARLRWQEVQEGLLIAARIIVRHVGPSLRLQVEIRGAGDQIETGFETDRHLAALLDAPDLVDVRHVGTGDAVARARGEAGDGQWAEPRRRSGLEHRHRPVGQGAGGGGQPDFDLVAVTPRLTIPADVQGGCSGGGRRDSQFWRAVSGGRDFRVQIEDVDGGHQRDVSIERHDVGGAGLRPTEGVDVGTMAGHTVPRARRQPFPCQRSSTPFRSDESAAPCG